MSVIWITGLSGSGKTTLGNSILSELSATGRAALLLDGDELREIFTQYPLSQNYDRLSRINLAMQYSKLCKMLSDKGFIIIIATISLFREVHLWNRNNIDNYLEIFLNIPLQILRERDPKQIYSNYDSGLISNVAGLDLEVDFPVNPDLIISSFDLKDLPNIANEVLKLYLQKSAKKN